jgi:hypothetical protein
VSAVRRGARIAAGASSVVAEVIGTSREVAASAKMTKKWTIDVLETERPGGKTAAVEILIDDPAGIGLATAVPDEPEVAAAEEVVANVGEIIQIVHMGEVVVVGKVIHGEEKVVAEQRGWRPPSAEGG